jgi:hypothetical protein
MAASHKRAELFVLCCHCGKPTRINSQYTFQKVSGWVQMRKQGGANAIALRRPMEVWSCSVCIDKLRLGQQVDQLSIPMADQLSLAVSTHSRRTFTGSEGGSIPTSTSAS